MLPRSDIQMPGSVEDTSIAPSKLISDSHLIGILVVSGDVSPLGGVLPTLPAGITATTRRETRPVRVR